MNYGIKEIEEFKAPTRKPWLILLIAVVAGLTIWQVARAVKSRPERVKKSVIKSASAVKQNAVSTSSASSVKVSKPAPVDLKAPGAADVKVQQPVTNQVPAVESSTKLDQARQLYSKGNRVGARDILLSLLSDDGLAKQLKADAETLIAGINIELALSPYDMPEKVDHVVERGDSLDKIAKKYGVTVQSIETGNAVKNANLIKAGDHLRVLDADFSIEVGKADHELVLLMNGKFFKRYKVGLGKFDKTPLGTFEVYDRIIEPVWWRPDGKEIPFGHEENILGTRWMAIRATGATPPVKGYGIHGTWDEASIGKSESAGCVRMRNSDVEELFKLVPLGTTVTIRP